MKFVSQRRSDSFYRGFLLKLCHDGLGALTHSPELAHLLGDVRYVNGGLFEPHRLERTYSQIDITNRAFSDIFDFFDEYDWHLDVRPNAAGNEINPDVLGYIFEQFVNQHEMGAFYTKEDVSQYVVRHTLIPAVIRRVLRRTESANVVSGTMRNLISEEPARYRLAEPAGDGGDLSASPSVPTQVADPSLNGIQLIVDTIESAESLDVVMILFDSLREIRILDPTCGSGAFLFAALNVLFDLYDACVERMERGSHY